MWQSGMLIIGCAVRMSKSNADIKDLYSRDVDWYRSRCLVVLDSSSRFGRPDVLIQYHHYDQSPSLPG